MRNVIQHIEIFAHQTRAIIHRAYIFKSRRWHQILKEFIISFILDNYRSSLFSHYHFNFNWILSIIFHILYTIIPLHLYFPLRLYVYVLIFLLIKYFSSLIWSFSQSDHSFFQYAKPLLRSIYIFPLWLHCTFMFISSHKALFLSYYLSTIL